MHTYRVGDPIRAMILRAGGTTLEPATVVEVGHHENQVHDLIPHIVVDFGDGQQRRYSGAGISDYTLPAETAPKPYGQGWYDTLRDTIPSDVPDTVWESDALSKGAGE